MATSADVGKETRKKFMSVNLKTTFGTRKTKEENLLHQRQNADLQNNSSAYQLKSQILIKNMYKKQDITLRKGMKSTSTDL